MFIVVEGLDGSGKSSISVEAADYLEGIGFKVTLIRDPGGTVIGERIRDILLDRGNANIHPGTELLLYLAARAQLLDEMIRPALERGNVVISDRFALSTFVYQSVTGKWDIEMLRSLVLAPYCYQKPDAILYLDTSPEVGFFRMMRRMRMEKNLDRIESKGVAFYQNIYEAYQRFSRSEFGEILHVVNASQAFEGVREDMFSELRCLLEIPH